MSLINIVDIETTGFVNAGGLIVEIGIAQLDTCSGKVKGIFGSTCREPSFSEKHADSWIFKNSTLTPEEVVGGPTLEEIREEVQEALTSCDRITAFNKKFDFDYLRSRNFTIGLEWPCPMIVGTNVCKVPKTGKQKHHAGFKWPKVEEAWAFFFPNHPYIEDHRGFDDAIHEAYIVNELYKLGAMGN